MRIRQFREVYRTVSKEFDKLFYVEAYEDIAAKIAKNPKFDIVEHYIRYGWHEKRNPTPWFSAPDYLSIHEDVRLSGVEPFFHYLKYGRKEGRAIVGPSNKVESEDFRIIALHFDDAYYSSQYPDIVREGLNKEEMIYHYLRHGWKEKRNPNSEFNSSDYLSLNADVRESGINPFVHYLKFGKEEGRVGRLTLDRRTPATSFSPSILFVSHSGNPAGAEIMLRDTIEWYGRNTCYNIDILVLSPGPLVNEYQKFGRVYALGENESVEDILEVEFLRDRYDYIYLNTVASGAFSPIYQRRYADANVPLILHVHEMAGVIKTYVDEFSGIRPHVDVYIGASEAVREDLINVFGVSGEQITVHYSFVKTIAKEWFNILRMREKARSLLNVADDDFLVLGAGTVYSRKGPDLFVDTIDQIIRRGATRVKAIWIGGGPDFDQIREDVEKRGLLESVDFVGYRADARRLIAAADLFFLSSREDPFPLVCLEAASYAIPTLHFRGCSGISTLTVNGAGVEVEALDCEAAADTIIALLENSDLREELGREARKRVYAKYEAEKSCLDLFTKLRERFGLAPAVSVIIPNYNHAKYLRQRIDSVLSQTIKDVEIIILDDASVDESKKVIQSYLTDQRIQFLENDVQSGSPFKQWAKGLSCARGRAVWIAESDDFCTPNFLEETLPRLTDEIAISFCRTDIVNAAGVVQEEALSPYLEAAAPGRYTQSFVATGYDEVSSSMAFCCTLVNASSALFQRSFLMDAVGAGTSYKMCGDWRIYLELLTKGGVAFTTEATNFFRRHASSAVHQLEGTDIYFNERAEIAAYVASKFNLEPRTTNRIVAELESEWRRFSHKPKMHSSLTGFFDLARFWAEVGSNKGPVRNIAFYVHGMLFSRGGIERQCALISRHLANQGYNVTIFCRLSGNSSPVFDVGQFVKIAPVFDETRIDESVSELRKLLVAHQIDVFIPMLSEWIFEPMIEAARGLNIKVVVSEHNDPKKIEELWWPHERRISTFRQADHVHLLLNKYKESLPIEFEKKISVIPNCVEFSPLVSDLPENRFIAIGRLVEQKGFDRLIKAMSLVVKKIPNATLDIYGDGVERPNLQKMITTLGLDECVRLRGETDQIPLRLSECTALLVSSRFEGLPIVILEAKVAGVPAIAYSDCNGPNELIIHSADGLLVPPDETGETFADAIVWLSEHPEELRAYQKGALESSMDYQPEPVMRKWVNMIESVGAQQFRLFRDSQVLDSIYGKTTSDA